MKPQTRAWLRSIRLVLLVLVLVSIVPLAGAMVYLALKERDLATAAGLHEMRRSVDFLAADLGEAVTGLGQFLRSQSFHPALQRPSEPACGKALAELQNAYSHLTAVFYTNLAGDVLCSGRPPKHPFNVADRDYFQLALRSPGPHVGRLLVGRASGRPVLPVSVAQTDASGATLGVFGAGIGLREFFEATLRRHGLDELTVTLVDPDGRVLVRLPADPTGLGDTSIAGTETFRTLEDRREHIESRVHSGLDGIERVNAYTRIEFGPTRFHLLLSVPTAAVLAYADEAFAFSLELLAVIGGLSVLAAWGISAGLIQRPLARLQGMARHLIAGDYAVPAWDLTSAVEFRTLAESLVELGRSLVHREAQRNEAENRLAEANAELEAKVAARTAELERTAREVSARALVLDRQRREATLRSELTDLLQTCQQIDETIPIMSEYLPRLTAPAAGAVYLLRDSRNVFRRVAAWGTPPPACQAFEPTACWAVRLSHTHTASEQNHRPRCPHAGPDPTQQICAPMLGEGQAIGLLHVACAGDADSPEEGADFVALVQAIAERVGLALANIRLRQALHDLAVHDPLTGLYNRRFMEEALEREIQRALRSGSGLAVLLVDVDHFKRFNDTFGHAAGDLVLQGVGETMRSLFRGYDIACRFGGEEFLLVLPGADRQAGLARAEQLRQAIADLAFSHQGRALDAVSISGGVALLPQHATDRAGLIGTADAALYRAKEAGRDRVEMAGDI